MKLIFFLLLLPCVLAQFFVLPDTHEATIEDLAHTRQECTILDIFVEFDVDFDLDKIILHICNGAEISPHKDFRQTKRFTSYISYIFTDYYREYKSDRKRRYGHERLAEVAALIGEKEIKQSYEAVSKILSWKGDEMAKYFGYDVDRLSDAWKAMTSKKLLCNKVNKLELHVCGSYNEERRRGIHKFVAVLGLFSPLGTIYKHIDIPYHAIDIDGQVQSVEDCRFLLTYYECYKIRQTNCTIHNYSNCTETADIAFSKIIVKYYGEHTVVAADVDTYKTMVDNVLTSHQMDVTKHVVLRLPYGSYAIFNSRKVYGETFAGDYDHFPVHNRAHASPITGEDLDYLEERYGDYHVMDNHRSLVEMEPVKSSTHHLFLIVLFIVLVVVAVIVVAVYYRHKTQSQNPLTEPMVVYCNEGVEFEPSETS